MRIPTILVLILSTIIENATSAATTTTDPNYMGCFTDYHDRVLPILVGAIKSVKECIEKCQNEGYRFAGVQSGNQCWCGNKYNKNDLTDNCNMKCPNNVDICGGNWVNSIYRIDPNYMGCFIDYHDRVLPLHIGDMKSVKECIEKCQNKAYRYAGVQNGNQCWCGNTYNKNDLADKCNMKCPNKVEICGGSWANSIYRTHPNSIGCFKNYQGLVSPARVEDIHNPNECIEQCQNIGYLYAGVQAGKGCWCGNEYNTNAPSDDCTMKCPNEVDICGGYTATYIYRTNSLSIGCFKDYPYRVLPVAVDRIQNVNECIKQCRDKGYLYAGVQDGHQCFCGDEYNKDALSDNCNLICPNKVEICGGSWASSIYRTHAISIGCFKDYILRVLPVKVDGKRNVNECIKQCQHKGYLYAGLQDGHQCWCGNKYNKYAPSDNCNMKCPNKVEICGGSWANSIYRTQN